jgi:hypothetical protein
VTATVAPLRARFAYNSTDILLLRFGTLNLSLTDRAPPSDAASEAPRRATKNALADAHFRATCCSTWSWRRAT